MRNVLCGAVLLALLCPPANATDWVKLGSAPSGLTLYYDRDTVKSEAGQVDVWDRLVYPPNHPASGGTPDKPVQYAELRGHHQIDCMSHTVISSEAQFYSADGALLGSVTLDSKAVAVTPQASSWAIGKLYCQKW